MSLGKIGDAAFKRVIIPAGVQFTGRCGAVVNRTKSALNAGGLSPIERLVTALDYIREVTVMDTLFTETVQVSEYMMYTKVDITKGLLDQVPSIRGDKDETGVYERIAAGAAINMNQLRGMNVCLTLPGPKLGIVQLFVYKGVLILFYGNAGHVFTLGKNGFKHRTSYGVSGGSVVEAEEHERVADIVVGALWYAQNVGTVNGMPKCAKPLDNAGSLCGIEYPEYNHGTGWKRQHVRRGHWKITCNGNKVYIPERMVGGYKPGNHTIKDHLREVRVAGSVAPQFGGEPGKAAKPDTVIKPSGRK